MPADDLILNVRQISSYTGVATTLASDALLLQRGGLGGPYMQITPGALVSTALADFNAPLQVGFYAPPDALEAQIFTQALSMAPNGWMVWNGYIPADVNGNSEPASYVTSGPAAQLIFDEAVGGFVWMIAPPGAAHAEISFANVMNLNPGGYLTVLDQIAVGRDPIGPGEVATAGWVARNTVTSLNGRTGPVRLNIGDILAGGGAPLFSPRFQGEPTAPSPCPWSNSDRLATTAFVWSALAGAAAVDSPAFTGVPTAPTAPPGTDTTQIATTAFAMHLDSPDFTGVPTGPTAALHTSTSQLATTAFVMNAVADAVTGVVSFNGRSGAVTLLSSDVASLTVQSFNGRNGAVALTGADLTAAGGALLASPVFTGTPLAPTAAIGTSTQQIATTAFVMNEVEAVSAGVVSFNSRSGAVTLQANDLSAVNGALLASPAFTGVPTGPTAAPGVSTTQLATCAYVAAALAAGGGVTTFNGRAGAVALTAADITGAGGASAAQLANYLPLAGGTLTGGLNGTGAAFGGVLNVSGGTINLSGAAATNRGFTWGTGASLRWAELCTSVAESGANAGSNFALNRYTDAGVFIDAPLSINRANGQATFSQSPLSIMQGTQTLISLSFFNASSVFQGAVRYNLPNLAVEMVHNNGNTAGVGSDGSFIITSTIATKPGGGAWTAPSDARIKTVSGPYQHGLDEVVQLEPVVYRYRGNDAQTRGGASAVAFATDRDFIGLVAQEVEPILPEMIGRRPGWIDGRQVSDMHTLDTGPLLFALVNAIKTLARRVADLEMAT